LFPPHQKKYSEIINQRSTHTTGEYKKVKNNNARLCKIFDAAVSISSLREEKDVFAESEKYT